VRPIAFPANDRNCPSDNSNAEGAQATKAANGDAIGDATYYERQSTYRGPIEPFAAQAKQCAVPMKCVRSVHCGSSPVDGLCCPYAFLGSNEATYGLREGGAGLHRNRPAGKAKPTLSAGIVRRVRNADGVR